METVPSVDVFAAVTGPNVLSSGDADATMVVAMVSSSSLTTNPPAPSSLTRTISLSPSPVSSTEIRPASRPRLSKYPIGTAVRKFFSGYGWFQGEIVSSDADYYKILYEDGDQEEMAEQEIAEYLLPLSQEDDPPAKKLKANPNDLWSIHGLDPTALTKHQQLFICGFTSQTVVHMADFWLFLYERQMIWQRRRRRRCRQPAPWTQCRILQTNSMCNVYRELDRGTAFFHAHVVKLWQQQQEQDAWTEGTWTRQVLWDAYVYRQMNRVTTFARVGFPTLNRVDDFLLQCGTLRQQGEAIFTGAHQTTNFHQYTVNLKQVAAAEGQLLNLVVNGLFTASTLEACLTVLRKLPGIGMFLGWQILCDLRESRCLAHVTADIDDFCALGPGAKQGIKMIFPSQQKLNHLALAKTLVQHQDTIYNALGLTFPKWNNQALGLKEVEHGLCEYAKYKKLENGSSGQRRWNRLSEQEDTQCRDCHVVMDSVVDAVKQQRLACDSCMHVYCDPCLKKSAESPWTAPTMEPSGWICHQCRAFASFSFSSYI